MSLPKKLGEIHNEFEIFSQTDFKLKKNVINDLKDFPHLHEFFKEYQKQFSTNAKGKISIPQARNTDLHYIGNIASKEEQADFLFYFEGSLAPPDRLSLTLMCHLWHSSDECIKYFCCELDWWNRIDNFYNVKNKLAIPQKIYDRSYIADAARIAKKRPRSDGYTFDRNNCQKLIIKEIELLKPKAVIGIGKVAKNCIGIEKGIESKFPEIKFLHRKFPKYHNENHIYAELREELIKIK